MLGYCDKLLIVTLLPFPNSVTISDYHCTHRASRNFGREGCMHQHDNRRHGGFASALWLKGRSINSDALYVRGFFTLGESAVTLYQFLLFHVTELVP